MKHAWPLPFWIAHRGAGKLAPENTLAAFRLGASYGYRSFECDVKLSADGVPFLLHDPTLERTTNARGVAGDLPWRDLSRLDAGSWHSRTYAGEPPPSLEVIARFVQRNHFTLNIEIKPTPGTERTTGLEVARAVRQLWATDSAEAPVAAGHVDSRPAPPLFSSFQPAALEGAREGAPEVARALLIHELRAGWLEQARALGCVAVVSNYALVDATMIDQVHGAGMRLLCYTVNDPAPAARLRLLGVDGLITDAVDRFSPADGAPA